MMTGDYEKDKAELERLIAHETTFMHQVGAALDVATRSRMRYQRMLNDLQDTRFDDILKAAIL